MCGHTQYIFQEDTYSGKYIFQEDTYSNRIQISKRKHIPMGYMFQCVIRSGHIFVSSVYVMDGNVKLRAKVGVKARKWRRRELNPWSRRLWDPNLYIDLKGYALPRIVLWTLKVESCLAWDRALHAKSGSCSAWNRALRANREIAVFCTESCSAR